MTVSPAQQAAAEAAMAAGMAADAQHGRWAEADLHAAYTDGGHSPVEPAAIVDDHAVTPWPS